MNSRVLIILLLYFICACSAVTKESRTEHARSDQSIMEVFDANKLGLYKIYSNGLKNNKNLSGKLIFSMSVSPEGVVEKCQLYSADPEIRELGENVRSYILKMDFGMVEGNVNSEFMYPIEFIPPPA